MIEPESITEIVAVYLKHGWILRRALLTKALKDRLEAIGNVLLDCPDIIVSDVDAAWFARPPKKGGVAWEIRHLNTVPYALLERIDETNEEFEEKLAAVEGRLRAAIASTKHLDKVAAAPSNLSN